MKKFFTLLLAILMLITVFQIPVAASGSTITNCIDLPFKNDDDSGSGYSWDNLKCILTLDGINLDTTDVYGIKLPAGSKIKINGDNYIKAGSFAIFCLGDLTIEGKGSLTLSCAENGITCYTTYSTDKLTFVSGKITINDAKNGIYSENTPIIFSGANVTVNATNKSVFGKEIKFMAGSFTAQGQIYSKNSVSISNANLNVTANDGAIVSSRPVNFTDVDVSVGENASSLTSAQSYNGEKAIKTVGTKKDTKNGFLFGGKLPAFVDYITIAVIALAASAVIVVPIIIKRKKTAELIKTSSINKKTKTKKITK